MPIRLNPYLNFRASAREAITFYQSVFGGELTISTFAEGGMPHDPTEADKIMHAQLETPNGLTLMTSDTPAAWPLQEGNSFSISLSGDEEDLLLTYWQKLLEGGEATMPLDKAPWGDTFGMLKDRFGVSWLVNISAS